jgi:pimeloyl-ACP methyl ester carboxylesterase
VARIARATLPRADWDVLAQVMCPVLILCGQGGQIRDETAERMLRTMPNARSQVIYGSRYDVFLGPGSEQTMAAIQLFLFGLESDEG